MLTTPAAHNSSAAPTPEPQPKRVLGLRDLVLFYIAATINVRWIAVAAAAGPSTLVIWLIGLATIFLPVALGVMELSSRYPQEGGMYVWSKHAYGDFAGYMTGWIYWMSNLPYYPAVLYFAASNVLYVGGQRWKDLQGSTTFFLTFSLLGLTLALILNVVVEQPGSYWRMDTHRDSLHRGRDSVAKIRRGDQLFPCLAKAALPDIQLRYLGNAHGSLHGGGSRFLHGSRN